MTRTLLSLSALVVCLAVVGCDNTPADPNAPTGKTTRDAPAQPVEPPGAGLKVENVGDGSGGNRNPDGGGAPSDPGDGG